MINTTISYFIIRGLNGVLALATMYCLTRLLSPTQYGVYALGIAAIGALSSVLFQWIAVTVARFYAQYAAIPDILLGEAYRVFRYIALPAALATFAFSLCPSVANATPALIVAIGCGTIAMGLHFIAVQIANSRIEPLRYGMLTISRGALALLGAIVFTRAGFGADGTVISAALACVLAVILFGYRRHDRVASPDRELQRQMIAYGLPLTLTYAATMVLVASDRFIIGGLLGTPAVAAYAAPYDLCQQTVGVALNVFFLVAYPKVTLAWEQGGAVASRQAMQPLARAMLWTTPLLMGLFVGMAKEIATIVFGQAIRAEAAQLMPWITLGAGIAFCKGYFLDIAFQLTRSTLLQLKITAAMALLNVALNVLLLPVLGIIGAAISSLAAFACGATASWVLGKGLGIYPLRVKDLVAASGVFLSMLLALHLEAIRPISDGYAATALRTAIALCVYLVVSIAVNLGGMRTLLHRRLLRRGGGSRP